MMQRIILAASILLIIQIGMAVAFNINKSALDVIAPASSFLSFTPSKVTSIEILGSDGTTLTLNRTESGWIMPDFSSAPASTELVETFLDTLAGAKHGLAVATTKGAAKRFKTSESNFERHLFIKEGNQTVADFYIGTSAGYRQSHARLSDQNEIITIPIGIFDVEPEMNKWLDQDLAKFNKDELKGVEISGISLLKGDHGWMLDNEDSPDVDIEKADRILDVVSELEVQTVLDADKVSSLFDDEHHLELRFTTKEDTIIDYTLVKNDDYYVLKMSNNSLFFKVDSQHVKKIMDLNLKSLTGKIGQQKEASSEKG